MFYVLENNKPAVLLQSSNTYWHNNKFDSLEEAIKYAIQWSCYGILEYKEYLEKLPQENWFEGIDVAGFEFPCIVSIKEGE